MIESKKPGIIAVIPCYNEEKHIAGVIKEALKYSDRVVVVDNMSTDKTASIAFGMIGYDMRRCRVRGVGAATRIGIAYTMSSRICGKDTIFVTLDGDGQHDPSDIPSLVSPVRYGRANVAFGVRCGGGMPGYRRIGNRILNTLYNIGKPLRLADSQCGFRAFSMAAMKDLLGKANMDNGFGYITEVALFARKRGYRISQVPVKCIYHNNHNDNSTSNPVSHGMSVVISTIKWRVKDWGLNEKVA